MPIAEERVGRQLVKLVGRVIGVRRVGKVRFYDVMRDHKVTQLTTMNGSLGIGRGDFIEAYGVEHPARDGSAGVKGDDVKIISKALDVTHFPDRKMGVVVSSNVPRCVDLLSNPASHEVFRLRAKIIRRVQDFLEGKGFLQVETPVLCEKATGAAARPFQTVYKDNERLYLRIAPELHLKQLIIGGFEKVYEIGKVFRCEGTDSTHNPEFTSLELYQSFAQFGNDLVPLVQEIFGLFPDFGESIAPSQTINIMSALEAHGIVLTLDDEQATAEQLVHYTRLHGLFEEGRSKEQLFDKMVERFVEPMCHKPSILTHFPLFTSPLAAASPENPFIADRLEVYVEGKEVANGYQELADPVEQMRRFKGQAAGNGGEIDGNYVDALKYGLPPTIGLGIGIDRLVMMLTKQKSIKNVIFFPRY